VSAIHASHRQIHRLAFVGELAKQGATATHYSTPGVIGTTAIFHAEALEVPHLARGADGRERTREERIAILLGVARSGAALEKTTPEKPLPPVALMPFGADYGQ
jgi:hypothetical protein